MSHPLPRSVSKPGQANLAHFSSFLVKGAAMNRPSVGLSSYVVPILYLVSKPNDLSWDGRAKLW